ncbi:SGNH/GDSL hydrolase family protein [Alicyclobacillus cycloheptanicus]|uniref:Acyl-CoA thioesterase-1 n=1 Tax=Alicyclobacillus cycloheptanicus TaxID=1457 RepID=A0ABT9XH46_9BACL|nr:SGNH/GDSL hydrolase family protein [Alicyclobacillus cycloheptanicus]MDQ0189621.1 acyl-CoA thioesterase-1 [Alicyclobacillus cycloheptanicus]WDL99930.1 SGNH/GDSL hydrolase family protein [Alicyclobacillus cycloheptanicus]
MRKTKAAAWSVAGLAAILAAGMTTACGSTGSTPKDSPSTTVHQTASPASKPKPTTINLASLKNQTIIAVGGSAASGWGDSVKHYGYLGRGMNDLEKQSGVDFTFSNQSVGGWGPVQMQQRFPTLLKQYKPKVVIIAWGLLDDEAKHTPLPKLKAVIQQEISESLAAGADVWIVTPPTTGSTYGVHSNVQQEYVSTEIAAGQSFHSSRVIVFDLLTVMKAYLKSHNIDIKSLEYDSWHPNTAGHTLAGQLMADLILEAGHAKTGTLVNHLS